MVVDRSFHGGRDHMEIAPAGTGRLESFELLPDFHSVEGKKRDPADRAGQDNANNNTDDIIKAHRLPRAFRVKRSPQCSREVRSLSASRSQTSAARTPP